MATRSTISRITIDGQIETTYCHWDGYISNNGRILQDFYTDPEKIDKLFQMSNFGGISSLKNTIEETAFYNDSNDTNSISLSLDEMIELLSQEFNYFWDGERWLVQSINLYPNWTPLEDIAR